MADTLSNCQIKASITGTFKNTLSGSSGDAALPIDLDFTDSLADGTTSDQADKPWTRKGLTLSSSGTQDIDVYDLGTIDIGAGAGKDGLGGSWASAEVVGLLVTVDASSTGTLSIGGEGSAAAWNSFLNASDTAKAGPIGPGGVFLIYRPDDPAFAVADTSNHLLRLTEESGSGSVTYNVCIIARSA